MRLIDADKLEQNIRDYADKKIMNPGYVEYANGIIASLRIIDEQPTVNQWIPVTERMPDKVLVLATVKHDEEISTVSLLFVFERDGKLQFENLDGDIFENVIAWQPLPEPYRDSEVEK